jgi:hypothetical protein
MYMQHAIYELVTVHNGSSTPGDVCQQPPHFDGIFNGIVLEELLSLLQALGGYHGTHRRENPRREA